MPGNKEVDEHHLKQSIVAQLLIAGSAACIADIATFPFDTAKGEYLFKVAYRLQMLSICYKIDEFLLFRKWYHFRSSIATTR